MLQNVISERWPATQRPIWIERLRRLLLLDQIIIARFARANCIRALLFNQIAITGCTARGQAAGVRRARANTARTSIELSGAIIRRFRDFSSARASAERAQLRHNGRRANSPLFQSQQRYVEQTLSPSCQLLPGCLLCKLSLLIPSAASASVQL